MSDAAQGSQLTPEQVQATLKESQMPPGVKDDRALNGVLSFVRTVPYVEGQIPGLAADAMVLRSNTVLTGSLNGIFGKAASLYPDSGDRGMYYSYVVDRLPSTERLLESPPLVARNLTRTYEGYCAVAYHRDDDVGFVAGQRVHQLPTGRLVSSVVCDALRHMGCRDASLLGKCYHTTSGEFQINPSGRGEELSFAS